MRPRVFTPLLGLVVLITTLSTPAAAQRLLHRVRFGETLRGISRHYYGSPKHDSLLRLANGLDEDAKPKAGEHVRIPTAWYFTTRKPITLKALAARFLGDERRWPALVAANRRKLGKKKQVKARQRLVIPTSISYRVVAGDSFVELSKRFYGTRRHSGLIADHNFIAGPHPTPDSQIEIPLSRPRVVPRVLEDLANRRLLGVHSTTELSRERREALQEANALLRRGEYWSVPLRLLLLLARDHPSDSYIVEAFKLLAVAYVALERHELAVKTFKEALLRRPDLSLDVVTTSSKVMRAYVDAKFK
jgi:LysM repeat protein